MNSKDTGLPTPEARQTALEWLITFWSGEISDHDRQAWRQWHDAHPSHQAAWRQVQHLESRLRELPGAMAGQTLRASGRPSVSRRRLLQGLGAVATVAVAGHVFRDSQAWRLYAADIHTGIGEIREITLSDGTRVSLNTASAIDVHFTHEERRVVLRQGGILVTTAHDARPFRVETRAGTIEALGTRFAVNQRVDHICVAVYEHRVRIRPRDNPDRSLLLEAGQYSRLTAGAASPAQPASDTATAWTRGRLIAEHMRLADFLDILGNYRRGIIHCDAAVADLVISGVFPLTDTDRVLASLSQALPVTVIWHTSLWITVEARPEKKSLVA